VTDDELKEAERRIWQDRRSGRLGAIHAIEMIMTLRKAMAAKDEDADDEALKE
jgi:hypothetical protein